jgi:hypothetical protein
MSLPATTFDDSPGRAGPARIAGMELLSTLAGLALALAIPVAIVVAIRVLAGDETSPSLAAFFAPLVAPSAAERVPTRPAVREDEPVRWRFAPPTPTDATA